MSYTIAFSNQRIVTSCVCIYACCCCCPQHDKTCASMHVHSAPKLLHKIGKTMPHDPLQIMTTDSVTCMKSSILRKGTRSRHLALVLILTQVLRTCRCCMCKCCSSRHMHITYHSQMGAYQPNSYPCNATAYMKLIICNCHLS